MLGTLFHLHTTGVYAVVTMCLVMGAYLVSLAPLAWLIMSEIFPNRLRGKAMAVASVCVWTACFLATNYFPPDGRLLQRGLRHAGDGLLDLRRRFGVGLFLAASSCRKPRAAPWKNWAQSWTKPKS